ncbi:MAG: hypothetical protein FWG96_02285 [Methanomassiliicoccaceae archaeon]|nr:hypothetical protein [Methanomassiliicoccaceae archaeon]
MNRMGIEEWQASFPLRKFYRGERIVPDRPEHKFGPLCVGAAARLVRSEPVGGKKYAYFADIGKRRG